MAGFVVVDQLDDWPVEIPGFEVVTAWNYLTHERFTRLRQARVYNLCRSYAYQESGYYVSLLAAARGHRVLPDVSTIQDLKLQEVPRVNDEIEDLIQRSMAPITSPNFTLSIYFGRNMAARHARLAQALYNIFPAPLLRARFHYVEEDKAWELRGFSVIPLGEVEQHHRDFLYQAAREHFGRAHKPRRRATLARYDMAILVNEQEPEPPSNARAINRFIDAAEDLGFEVETIDKADYGRVAEFDALFIRETTAVNHHTYRFASRAARNGLVVIDDPDSILRCANKVYLAQLLQRHRIPQPKTLLLHRANLDQVAQELGFPCVLKQPDSAFSKGVLKVDDAVQYRVEARRLLDRSDLIVAQAFVPTEYDWRIGVLDGQPLFACRYYMAPKHWQVVKRDAAGRKREGGADTLPIWDVPPNVLDMALAAARAIGDGLYGVDLKQFENQCRVIEINDNPNIDAGIEDKVLKDQLYRRIMEHFLRRCESRTRQRERI